MATEKGQFVDAEFKWTRGDKQKHPECRVWRTWVGTNGYSIWQGRPHDDRPSGFVYRLELPSGVTEDYRLLNDAKQRGRAMHGMGFRVADVAVPSSEDQIDRLTRERDALLQALKEIALLRLATDESSLRVRADLMWKCATAAIALTEGK